MDRRAFLRRTGVAASSVGLVTVAGCLGSGGGNTSPTAGNGTSTKTLSESSSKLREKYGLKELDYELEDRLNVFQWTAYWPTEIPKIFSKVYGVDLNIANYTSNEEMFAKLKAGGTEQFDVIFPSDYMINILAHQKMIRKLDLGKIPNFDNLERYWIKHAPYDPDPGRYSAPYFWGTSGIAWNEKMLKQGVKLPLNSWDAMWSEQFKGQITMLDDMRETIGASLKRLGYSLNTKDKSKIEEAKQELIDQKPLLQAYSSTSMVERLVNKSTSPMHTWSGDAFKAYWQLYKDGSTPIGYRMPKEGGVVWMDCGAVTKNAKHPNAAHAFINYVLNAKINAKIANWVYYPSPNEAAKQYIKDAMLQNEVIYPPLSVIKELEFIRNVGKATKYYSQAWTEIKTA